MARFAQVLSLLIAFCACAVSAAPIAPAQAAAALQCDIARVQIVASVNRTVAEVNDVIQGAGADVATAAAASTAAAALQSAQAGIDQIAAALLAGKAPPQASRDIVEQGFADAGVALDSIVSTDPAILAQVTEAKDDLESAASAGELVIANC
ncbi:hypothetical protein FA15DRAFT_760517 [Coprinopsis marcescibilis]|uniref:Cell wall protein n=1 Tax=Coprinopsis marcescibilis TaxID=230819 RepID=A0A5C3KFK4_COPMA|nr:hypothetical protein FA15DRAFT_760517 [Coprinopsis marcescibilis]